MLLDNFSGFSSSSSPMDSIPSPYPVLKFLNEFAEIHKTQNHLPHWQQDQATYFLTFRLGDSIPADLLRQWQQERDHWTLNHPKPWSPEAEAEYHKNFSSRIDQHLDQGHGSCLFRDAENATIVAGAFRHFDRSRYLLHAWVIMPNHVHLLLTLGESESLARSVASWKRFSAVKIHQQTQDSGTLWQKDYFDRMIRDWDHFVNVARYIRRNPLKAKLREGEFLLEEAAWIKRLLA
ncbi:MAG: REP-associated tyrosine transposase [Luteolibacter sp.]